ncbi:MAG TPA: rhomboid family intramembrane serine protease [Mycobacteriales bacterium]|nr:rhomboid family intramembrane serine protease [Mycobacteriales bacterium]
MSDGQTGQDADWSERYAETGGWPPPAADQRRYEPGVPGTPGEPDPTAPWTDSPTGAGAPGDGPHDRPDGPADGVQPGYGSTPDQGGYGSGPAYGGPGQTGYGTQAGPAYGGAAGQWGPPPQWSQAASWDQPANQPGPPPADGVPQGPWAPGDSAYGRLSGGGPRRTPPQPQRRPWDNRPQRARTARSGGTPITLGLIAVCVVVFLLQQADPTITTRYGLVPLFVEQGQWERLITSAFLHANVLHLATNMLTLYIVGAPLERVLRTGRYLTIYLLSALGGSLLSLWLSPQFSIGVGASGAIFGLFGALLILRRQVGAEASGLVVLIGLNLFISFAVPNISWQAHIGGLITGVLVALALRAADRARRRPAA